MLGRPIMPECLVPESLSDLELERAKLLEQFLGLGDFRPGSITASVRPCARPNRRLRNLSAGNSSANNWWPSTKKFVRFVRSRRKGAAGRHRQKNRCCGPSGNYARNKLAAGPYLCRAPQDRSHGLGSCRAGATGEPASDWSHSLNRFVTLRSSRR
jgi:hypothetical protein